MKASNGLPLVYCAIDTKDLGRAKELANAVSETGCGVKLGLEFFNANGPQGVQTILEEGFSGKLFLDLKYHDIPNTVASAIESVSSLDVAFLNVHASGGAEMMQAARRACPQKTKLLAVTVLTSLTDSALSEVGQPAASGQVQRLAALTRDAGLDGVVCSAHEIKILRETLGSEFILMVPGIRPAGSDVGDQKRVMTPAEAVSLGATHLVIGRPITQAVNPAQAAKDILDSIANGP